MKRGGIHYKGMKVNFLGLPVVGESKRKIKKLQKVKRFYNVSFSSYFSKNSPKNLIIMYDIPSERKKERDWLRRQLIRFDYILIQKSVWVGPSPLPKNFLKYLKQIGLKDQLRIFKLAKPFDPKGNSIRNSI